VQSLRQSSTAGNAHGLLVSIAGTTGNNTIFQADAGGAARMLVRGDGNVGIGTNNPQAALHVATNGSFPLFLESKTYSPTRWAVGPWNGTNHFYIIDENSQGMYLTKGSGATGWTVNSDRRLKTNIKPLSEEKGLAAILNLKPVTYTWRNQLVSQEEQTGFIAQEVREVFPHLVTQGRDDSITLPDGSKERIPGTLGVNYTGLVIPLVKAVQELEEQIRGLLKANHELKIEIKTVEQANQAKIRALEAADKEKARELASLKEALCEMNPKAKACRK